MQSAGGAFEHRTICRLCAATCGMIVTVSDHRIVDVRGDATHPASQGYSCAKGRALGAIYHDPHRLDHPSIHGTRVAWPVMLDDVAERFRRRGCFELLQNYLTRFACHDESRMNDHVRRQLVHCLKVMTKSLVNHLALFGTCSTNVLIEKLVRHLRNDRRNLRLFVHCDE